MHSHFTPAANTACVLYVCCMRCLAAPSPLSTNRLLLEGADVSHAVGAPRLHDQLVPNNSSFYENYTFGYTHHQMPAGVVKQLQARDQLTTGVDRGIGVSQAIYVDYDTAHSSKALGSGSRSSGSKGVLVAASDSRKDGAPLGYDL